MGGGKNGGASNADRVRAHSIRQKSKAQRTGKERAWLRSYEMRHGGPTNGSQPRERKGRHRVQLEIETGSGGDDERKTPELVRAEGERIDRVLNACSAMVEAATAAFKDQLQSRDGLIKMLLDTRSKTERLALDGLLALRTAVVSSATAEAQLAALQAAQELDEQRQAEGLDRDFMTIVKKELGIGGGDAKSNGHHGPNGKPETGGEG